MAGSCKASMKVSLQPFTPARTTGPLGRNDAGDPDFTTLLGDTAGPVGRNDYGDPTLTKWSPFSFSGLGAPVCSDNRIPLSLGNRAPRVAGAALPSTSATSVV